MNEETASKSFTLFCRLEEMLLRLDDIEGRLSNLESIIPAWPANPKELEALVNEKLKKMRLDFTVLPFLQTISSNVYFDKDHNHD